MSQISSWLQHTRGAQPASNDRRIDALVVSDEDVAERAYQKFLARGSVHGFDQRDWTEAQHELVAEVFQQ